jgi:hypothetical protein
VHVLIFVAREYEEPDEFCPGCGMYGVNDVVC